MDHRCLSQAHLRTLAVQLRIAKAWNAFFIYKDLLCHKGVSIVKRLQLFNAVISMVVMWCLCTCTLTKADFHRLDVSMLSMICSMVRLRRLPDEEWIPYYIRRRRHARQVLKDHQINLWSIRAALDYFQWAQRICSHGAHRMVRRAITWMNLEWWGARQQNVREGQREFRHPGRFVPRWREMRPYNFQKWVATQLNGESLTSTKLAEGRKMFWHMYCNYIARGGEIFIRVPSSSQDNQSQSQEE